MVVVGDVWTAEEEVERDLVRRGNGNLLIGVLVL